MSPGSVGVPRRLPAALLGGPSGRLIGERAGVRRWVRRRSPGHQQVFSSRPRRAAALPPLSSISGAGLRPLRGRLRDKSSRRFLPGRPDVIQPPRDGAGRGRRRRRRWWCGAVTGSDVGYWRLESRTDLTAPLSYDQVWSGRGVSPPPPPPEPPPGAGRSARAGAIKTRLGAAAARPAGGG